MPYSQSELSQKIREYLKKHAPYSIVDKGLEYANQGYISECSKSGKRISGVIRDTSGSDFYAFLDIISGKELKAHCDCCSDEDIAEQWCAHVVALLWRASELEFFEPKSGFASNESTYRMNMSSPDEIASMLREVNRTDPQVLPNPYYHPEVRIVLDLNSDRLGVKVFFDEEEQSPTLFEGFDLTSDRALDTILLQILEDEGNWDESQNIWYINSSKGIELILGLVQEYDNVFSMSTFERVQFSRQLLEAKFSVKWLKTAAELVISWILPDGTVKDKKNEVLGTGPYWTVLDNTIYRISPRAARISAVFPYSSTITLPKSQTGAILEIIQKLDLNSDIIEIQNQELQPDCETKEPTPILELTRRSAESEHFSSSWRFELVGLLEFEYPAPPEDQNIVYLPHREKEKEHLEHLKALGFDYSSEKKYYLVTGDQALDLANDHKKLFPSGWKIRGVDLIKKSLRFAALSLNVSMTSSPEEAASKTLSSGWFDCRISLVQNNSNTPLSKLFKNYRTNTDRWVRLDNGAFAQVPGGGLSQLHTILGMLSPNYKLSNTIKTRLTSAQALSFSRFKDDLFEINTDRRLKALARKLDNFENIDQIGASKNFVGKLRPYQDEGISWMNFLHSFNLDGILADEMGLGKTVQALALFQYLKDSRAKNKKLAKPVLIVAPTSVITNWSYEARRFSPKLSVLLLHGPKRKEHFSEISDYNLVITSYALLRLDRYDLEKHEYSYVVLDEAQNIKNPQAATTKAAKSIKAERRLALSGTPTENRPLELWSIFDFLMPGYLGSSEFFKANFERPILESGTDTQAGRFLKTKTRPFILRRLKSEVEKDLPPKIESLLHVPMTHSQAELYGHILAEVRPRVFDAIREKGIGAASISILAALLRLRQVCNHPNSIEAFSGLPGYESGKFNAMKELVEESVHSGRKVLLFSQFREMLAIIRRWLDAKPIPYLYLDGTTKKRQDLVDRFNSDENVQLFLISLKAGGTGLNLTGADTVIIYDPWWNPAVEVQAVDRAHRIGQTKPVSVYRLITENSIEQKIMALKNKKAKIVDALINENGLSSLKLTKRDLENLFAPLPEDE